MAKFADSIKTRQDRHLWRRSAARSRRGLTTTASGAVANPAHDDRQHPDARRQHRSAHAWPSASNRGLGSPEISTVARHVTTNLRVRHSATVSAPNRPTETASTRPATPLNPIPIPASAPPQPSRVTETGNLAPAGSSVGERTIENCLGFGQQMGPRTSETGRDNKSCLYIAPEWA